MIFNRCQLLWWHLTRQHMSWEHLSISAISQLLLFRFCHTRSNLGISALLEILQSCKLDHKLAWFCTGDQPPNLVGNQTFMQYRRLEFGGFLKGVGRMSERCLEAVWLVCARYREGVWRVQRRCVRSFNIYLNPKYFWGPKFFGHK